MKPVRTLRMIRRLDEPLPGVSVPSRYVIRSFQIGEERLWGETLNQNGELGSWDEARIRQSFNDVQKKGIGQVWKESIHFAMTEPVTSSQLISHEPSDTLTRDPHPVATACIQRHRDHPDLPELSWVSVLPGHRNQGIGKALCLTMLHFMQDHEYKRCFVRTNTSRLDAVRTFLSVGFIPFQEHPTYDAERWRRVLEAIER